MTKDSSTGYYVVEVPDEFANGSVIFTENSTATINRYPADMEPGLELSGSSMKFSANYYNKTNYNNFKDKSYNCNNCSKQNLPIR